MGVLQCAAAGSSRHLPSGSGTYRVEQRLLFCIVGQSADMEMPAEASQEAAGTGLRFCLLCMARWSRLRGLYACVALAAQCAGGTGCMIEQALFSSNH
jgi:hypothetical protein